MIVEPFEILTKNDAVKYIKSTIRGIDEISKKWLKNPYEARYVEAALLMMKNSIENQ